MSAVEPSTFDDALRLEGIVLNQHERADLWRRLSDAELFTDNEAHYRAIEIAEDDAEQKGRAAGQDDRDDNYAFELERMARGLGDFGYPYIGPTCGMEAVRGLTLHIESVLRSLQSQIPEPDESTTEEDT